MKTFKITFANGNSFNTGFNGNINEARAYYLGNYFNLGSVEDDMQKCVAVEQIFNLKFKGREVGAIGAFSEFNIQIVANDGQDLLEKLYNKFEHISGLKIS